MAPSGSVMRIITNRLAESVTEPCGNCAVPFPSGLPAERVDSRREHREHHETGRNLPRADRTRHRPVV